VGDEQGKPVRPRIPREKLAALEVPKPDPRIGQVVLERYVIEANLGKGAMGTVYRGSHVKLKRPVAIKILHGHLGRDRTMLARFDREAKAAARLHHPNVVGVLDVGETAAGEPLMVMEFAKGESLVAVMGAPLAPARIVALVTALLRGLEHAHAAGLVHRDLKPDNVIVEVVDGVEVPRIIDFGIAAILHGDETTLDGERLTALGMMIGTPRYMAPEQALGTAVDHRVDLFALGVMTYEMLAGRPPFTGTTMEVVMANIHEDPPPIAGPIDARLEAFARRLMTRDLDQRVASARDALALLGQ
jgi:serine/threonine-protein kinase